jgi:hypothetical protein
LSFCFRCFFLFSFLSFSFMARVDINIQHADD